ncbi:hypothetical protein [Dactylosporangium cerinum]
MLTTYFPGPGHEEDHSEEFIRRYKRFGEETIEFLGIKTELEDAINRHPMVAALEVNFALGLDLPDDEVRKHLMSLYDQINELGVYDRERIKAQRPEGTELLRSYFLVPVRLPAALTQRKGFPSVVPIGAVFVAGLLLLVAGTAVFRLLPAALHLVANFITVIGLLTMGLSAWAMFWLRRAALHPEEAAEAQDAESAGRRRKGRKADEPRAPSRWAAWTRFRT